MRLIALAQTVQVLHHAEIMTAGGAKSRGYSTGKRQVARRDRAGFATPQVARISGFTT